MRSIRTTLTVSLLAGAIAATLAAGSVLYSQVRSSLVAQFDAALAAKARALGSQLEVDGDHLGFEYVPGLMPEFEGGEKPEYFQMSTPEGEVLDRSATLAGAEMPVRFGPTERPSCFDLELRDGRAGRAAGIVLVIEEVDETGDDDEEDGRDEEAEATATGGGPRVVIVVARGREEVDSALAAVGGALVLSGGILVAAVVLVVAFAVRRGLRPLVDLGRQVERIDASCLDARLERDGLPAELRPTADKLNELLERLASAFARERRMSGNLAHELRTPIAELRAAVDVARRWPDDVSLRDAAIDTAHAVSARMGDLVAGLLRLARLASGSAALEAADVELRELVDTAWRAVEAQASERGLRFEHSTPSGVVVRTDGTLLSIIVSNLLDNAVRFADPDSTITCGVEGDGVQTGLTWTIANRTSALESQDLRHLTEPFWQKSGARSDGRHAGLGLTLVNAAARALGIELTFRLDGAFVVALAMPLARRRASRATA